MSTRRRRALIPEDPGGRGTMRGGLRAVLAGAVVAGTLGGAVVAGVAPAVLAASAAPGAGARGALPRAPALPPGAHLQGALGPSVPVQAEVVLAPRDPAALDTAVGAVSEPGSPEYHHFLAPGQFARTYGPDPADVAATRAWLSSVGLTVGPTDPDGFVIPVSGSADVVAHAFSTALSAVRLADGSTSYVQSGSASVPADLAPHITSVVGLSAASRYDRDAVVAPPPGSAGLAGARSTPLEPADPLELAQSTGAAGAAGCTAAQATGGTLQSSVAALYGFSDLFAQGRTGTGQTIALYELEGYSAADVEQFEQCFGRSATVSSVTVDGGPLPSAAAPGSGEAALDIENTLSFAPATRVVVYEGPNDGGVGPMDVYRRIADDDAAPVVATSWGICEAANGAAAEQAEAQIFDQMALDGQTVVAASGDAGSEDCYPQGPNATSLAVDDPGSQPTVTSVGGTALSPSAPAGQVVWNSCDGLGASCARSGGRQGAGGGGVSSTWALPSYQAARVLSPCPAGATTGTSDCRQVPDVAALAAPSPGYPIVWDGRWTTAGGTSAAAPLWAALFADADQGCNTPLGSVDPALYALGDAQAPVFGDVTTGDNDFLQTNGGQYGAGTGYDLASGWGSPESGALVAALQPAGGCPSVVGLSAPFGPLSGGTLTITGSGLGGASAVDVGALGPASIVADTPTSITVSLPTAPRPIAVDVTVVTPNGTSPASPVDRYVFGVAHTGAGYVLGAADGGIFAFGDAPYEGSMGGRPLVAPVVGIAPTPDGRGYWEVAADGGIFAFGDAPYEGSMGGHHLDQRVVGVVADWEGRGYWEVAADGGIFAFGDAPYEGSMGGIRLVAPVVGIAPSLDSEGYWEVAADGGIFAFGDAPYEGSMGGIRLVAPVVGIAGT